MVRPARGHHHHLHRSRSWVPDDFGGKCKSQLGAFAWILTSVHGWQTYWQSGWNVFDFIVMLLCVAAFLVYLVEDANGDDADETATSVLVASVLDPIG